MGARTRANISDYSLGITANSTPVLPAYFGRNFLLIKNNGPGAAAVNLRGGTAAANTIGNIQLASGQSVTFQKNVPQNAISAISASTSQLTVWADDSLAFPSFIFATSPPPNIDLNFITGNYWIQPNVIVAGPSTFLTTTRATTNATNLLPISAAGATITTFGANIPRITSGLGLLVEETRTNQLLNSTAPATQTTGALGVATFTLWVNGTGSATASVGTATAPSLPLVATQGVPQTFAVTVGGTVVVTVAGSLNAFQLEQGVFGTSLIVTAGAVGTRNSEVVVLTNPPSNGSTTTIYGQGTPQAPASFGINQAIVDFSDGTANNRLEIFRLNATAVTRTVLTNGGASTVSTSGTLATNASGKGAFASANNDQSFVFNGTAPVVTAVAWPPAAALNRIDFGTDLGNTIWDGYVERVAIWPETRLSNAIMQAITT